MALLRWDFQTAVGLLMELTSLSWDRTTRAASTLTERATFLWCCKHWWTIKEVLPTSSSGKVHDARVFRNSGLFRRLQEGIYFPDRKITVEDVEMPIVILGDPAYLLMPWLMKPY
ncbi:hypothetical protein G0U57_019523, partial [Chelydra serpentina]